MVERVMSDEPKSNSEIVLTRRRTGARAGGGAFFRGDGTSSLSNAGSGDLAYMCCRPRALARRLPALGLSCVHPISKRRLGVKPIREHFISFRQRMARIRVERAGQRGGHEVRHMIFFEPVNDAVAEPAKRGKIFLGHAVFVERPDHYKHVVV